ncbi:hypothetical protein XENORESO_003642 [Xenotaenia resolanae]|uniref:Uncharacterized protein n=1 Tax=Xenotaenia resolanae TaxID=208358 RepID=A0ABV0WP05_9TELE
MWTSSSLVYLGLVSRFLMVPYSSVRFYAIMHSMELSSHPTFRKEIGSVSKDECALVKMLYIKEGSLQSLGTPSQLLSTEMAVSCCVCVALGGTGILMDHSDPFCLEAKIPIFLRFVEGYPKM